jgi:hypothetical protein
MIRNWKVIRNKCHWPKTKKLTFDDKIHATRGVLFALKIDKRTKSQELLKKRRK